MRYGLNRRCAYRPSAATSYGLILIVDAARLCYGHRLVKAEAGTIMFIRIDVRKYRDEKFRFLFLIW